MKPAPENLVRKHRVRSYKSLIINLIALIGLFALVFVLQQLGTRHAEKTGKTEPATQVAEVAAEEVTLEKQEPAAAPMREKKQEVEIVEIQTTEKCTDQPKPRAKTATRSRKAARNRTYRSQLYREDRLRSAELVDMLDGGHSDGYSSDTPSSYNATNSNQPTYASADDPHSGDADRIHSAELVEMLDGRASQSDTQKSNSRNWANEVPMASSETQNGTRSYAAADPQEQPTYVAPGRRPAWDVNAGDGTK